MFKVVIRKLKSFSRIIKTYGFIEGIRYGKSIVFRTQFQPRFGVEADYIDKSVSFALERAFRNIQPLDYVKVSRERKRFNLVTDSVSSGSLLGGVATALILATLFCKKNDYDLRIIVRCEPVVPKNYYALLKNNNIDFDGKVEFYSDYERDVRGVIRHKVDISENDIFFATSWWSAKAIRRTIKEVSFFYIIQEVETFFYPHGEDHYMCSQIMEDKNISFIVNSKYLWDYFKENTPNITDNGVYFEPAFSQNMYHRENFSKNGKKYRLFFYARPNNPRNMYHYGLKILNLAVERGIISADEWIIYLAGADNEQLEFPENIEVKNNGLMSWKKYSDFLRTVDLTLSLMYTPHPSYPPYDSACSGAVVITNKCLNKTAFEECKNIVLSDLDIDIFLDKLKEAVDLAKDYKRREKNYKNSLIKRDWDETLGESLQYMTERVE